MDYNVAVPSKPRIVSEENFAGVYEIDGLYPGYGHTLGNSLRRIILSSLPGAAITTVKFDNVPHEFTTIGGVKEDVITILLNLKKVRLAMYTDEPQTLTLEAKKPGVLTAGDIKVPGQVTVLNGAQHIAEITGKNSELSMELRVEKGLGYVAKEALQQEKMDIGSIALDASFTPIRRVNYEVENMRVGDKTDFNRLRIFIETDGTITPREALEKAIEIMIYQLKAIIGFKEKEEDLSRETLETALVKEQSMEKRTLSMGGEDATDSLKTRIESVDLSPRTVKALSKANIRTIGGLVRKKEEDILSIEGLGVKGLQEIKRALGGMGMSLKS